VELDLWNLVITLDHSLSVTSSFSPVKLGLAVCQGLEVRELAPGRPPDHYMRESGDSGSKDDSLSRTLRSGTFWNRPQNEQECSLRLVAGKMTEINQSGRGMM